MSASWWNRAAPSKSNPPKWKPCPRSRITPAVSGRWSASTCRSLTTRRRVERLLPARHRDARCALAPPDDHAGHAQHRHHHAHEGNQDAARQAEDAARMQRELRLHEDIRRRALPRLAVADQAAVRAIEIQHRRTDAAGAMVISRLEEADAVDAELLRIEDAAGRLGPL